MANTYEVITFQGKISSKWPNVKVSIAEAILIILLIIGFECNTDNFRYEFTRLFLKQKYNSEKYLTLKVNKLGNSSWDASWIIYWIINKVHEGINSFGCYYKCITKIFKENWINVL